MAAVIGFLLGFAAQGFYDNPIFAEMNYQMWRLLPLKELPTEQLGELFAGGVIDEKELVEKNKMWGYGEDKTKLLIKPRKNVLTAEQMISAKWRGAIDDSRLEEYAKRRQIDVNELKTLEKVIEPLPSPSDVIRFSVREVYRKETVEKYGYDQEFPKDAIEDAKKVGLSEETLRKYWRAHWELPSITQGMVMLQRLDPEFVKANPHRFTELNLEPEKVAFSINDFKELLAVQDIAPYWRDKLAAVVYRPLTRIDLRRAYVRGLKDIKDVYWGYRQLGYSPTDAETLTKIALTERFEELGVKFSELVIEKYKIGLLTLQEAVEELKKLGYSEEEAKITLEHVEARELIKEVKSVIAKLISFYRRGKMSESQLRDQLASIGLTARAIDRYVQQAKVEKGEKV